MDNQSQSLRSQVTQQLNNGADLNSLSDDQRKKLDSWTDQILDKIFEKISLNLEEADLDTIAQLDSSDPSGENVKNFLLSKTPNLDAIVQEEIRLFKEQNEVSDISNIFF